MMKHLGIGFIAMGLLACGGSSTPAESPDGPRDAGEEPIEVSSPPSDGIVRDADGDGVPDDRTAGCDGKNETQCQITAGCAWSDDERCVEAAH
jgi:hypothetical protein